MLRSIADKRSINACMITENFGLIAQLHIFLRRQRYSTIDRPENELKTIDLILATRLTDEHFRGIINFEKAAFMETPVDEIQKALVS